MTLGQLVKSSFKYEDLYHEYANNFDAKVRAMWLCLKDATTVY